MDIAICGITAKVLSIIKKNSCGLVVGITIIEHGYCNSGTMAPLQHSACAEGAQALRPLRMAYIAAPTLSTVCRNPSHRWPFVLCLVLQLVITSIHGKCLFANRRQSLKKPISASRTNSSVRVSCDHLFALGSVRP
jgi:hypothetical protein